LLLFIVASLATPDYAWAQQRPPLVQTVDILIPSPPRSVTIAKQRHLAYELHVTNFRPYDVVLTRIEIIDAVRGSRVAEFRDSQLAAVLGRSARESRALSARPFPWRTDRRLLLAAGGRWRRNPRSAAAPDRTRSHATDRAIAHIRH
jgi:hypothetical protein